MPKPFFLNMCFQGGGGTQSCRKGPGSPPNGVWVERTLPRRRAPVSPPKRVGVVQCLTGEGRGAHQTGDGAGNSQHHALCATTHRLVLFSGPSTFNSLILFNIFFLPISLSYFITLWNFFSINSNITCFYNYHKLLPVYAVDRGGAEE